MSSSPDTRSGKDICHPLSPSQGPLSPNKWLSLSPSPSPTSPSLALPAPNEWLSLSPSPSPPPLQMSGYHSVHLHLHFLHPQLNIQSPKPPLYSWSQTTLIPLLSCQEQMILENSNQNLAMCLPLPQLLRIKWM